MTLEEAILKLNKQGYKVIFLSEGEAEESDGSIAIEAEFGIPNDVDYVNSIQELIEYAEELEE